MSPSTDVRDRLAEKTALLIGVGGLGCPAARVLARAGVGRLILVDDDQVELSNLHRQILYSDADLGRHKLDAAEDALLRLGAAQVRLERTRFLPDNARELVRLADVVLEGADNFATKFLAADACYLEARPLVHGAGVRWHGTALAVGPRGAPCYRCLFEDVLPAVAAPNCAEAGVMAPVVGLIGALQADLALDLLLDDTSRLGQLHSYDGQRDRLRAHAVRPRATCPLCGPERSLFDIEEGRYFETTCAAPSQLTAPRAAHPPHLNP